MIPMPNRLFLARLGVLAAVVVAACRSTEPIPGHPLAGVYDFSTRLDTFGWETGVPSPPDCPAVSGLYCFHERAFTGASLEGTLALSDSGNASTLYFSANVQGKFCDAIDPTVGCTHLADRPLHPLPTFYLPVGQRDIPRGTSGDTTTYHVQIFGPGSQPGVEVVSLRYHATGDSLYGQVYWAMAFTRDPPHHTGAFVARRRR